MDRGEFSHYGVQVDRIIRCGLCSQRAFWLSKILREHGTEAELLGLEGHVVVIVRDAASHHWILDPDYGTDPFLVNIASSEAMAHAATNYYSFLSRNGKSALHRELIAIYATTDNNQPYNSKDLRRIDDQQQRWLKRLEPTIRDIRRSARAKFQPLSPIDWEQHGQLPSASDLTAGHILPPRRPANRIPASIRHAIAGFEAAAIHATLVAASIKYGSRGYGKPNVILRPLDYVSLSPALTTENETSVTLHNWGYRPVYLQLAPDGRGACALMEAPGSTIMLRPDTTLSLTYRRDCSVSASSAAQ